MAAGGARRGPRARAALGAPEPAAGHPVGVRPEDVEAARKADLLRACDERARAAGGEVSQVRDRLRRGAPAGRGLQLRRAWRRPTTARACGSAPRWWRAATGAVETGTDTRGGHAGFELLEADPEAVAERPRASALTLLDAVDAPTGRMPVVVGNGFGGVLLHEAVGHGLEADAVQKRASVYAGKLGRAAAPSRS